MSISNLCGCTVAYLGIKMCLQQIVPNQDFDRITSLQQCDETLCSMQLVSFGVFAHLEVIWLDLEKDYQDFAIFCVATRENHLRHICLQIVRLCLTLRTVLNEQSWLQLKKKKNYTKMSNYRKLCHKKIEISNLSLKEHFCLCNALLGEVKLCL